MTQAEAAATWWADKLRGCKQSGLSDAERRDPSNRAYQMAEMLMSVTRPKVSEDQITAFKASLLAGIEGANLWARSCIAVDYGCDPLLSDALAVAGIPYRTGILPIKTSMWLREDGSVSVRYGYGAEIQELRPPDSTETVKEQGNG